MLRFTPKITVCVEHFPVLGCEKYLSKRYYIQDMRTCAWSFSTCFNEVAPNHKLKGTMITIISTLIKMTKTTTTTTNAYIIYSLK